MPQARNCFAEEEWVKMERKGKRKKSPQRKVWSLGIVEPESINKIEEVEAGL